MAAASPSGTWTTRHNKPTCRQSCSCNTAQRHDFYTVSRGFNGVSEETPFACGHHTQCTYVHEAASPFVTSICRLDRGGCGRCTALRHGIQVVRATAFPYRSCNQMDGGMKVCSQGSRGHWDEVCIRQVMVHTDDGIMRKGIGGHVW